MILTAFFVFEQQLMSKRIYKKTKKGSRIKKNPALVGGETLFFKYTKDIRAIY
ncbi:hypothetical protein NY10_67 [Carnobacterium antarcticum]|nr:hypothetical protein NY10_67 [Carnobacterium sp. CP1]